MKPSTPLYAAALLFAVLVSASAQDTLTIGTFGGGGLADRFANVNGYYAEKNIQVINKFVISSDQQFDSLDSGEYDLISTTGDNIVYRRLNLGRDELTVLTESSGSSGMWLLANRDLGIHSIQDMAGKTIQVDSPNSGFVIPLRKIFQAAGIPLSDSLFIPAGGLNQRIVDLIAGRTNATMSTGSISFVQLAKNPQLIKLGDMRELVCPYAGGTLVALNSWLNNPTNNDKLNRFLRAQLRGWKYAVDPAHKQEVIDFFMNSQQINETLANVLYDNTVSSPDSGLNAYMVPRRRGIVNAVNVRVNDLRLTRESCLPIVAELVSRPGGWINLGPLMTAAGQELGYWNVLGQYYQDAPVPCN